MNINEMSISLADIGINHFKIRDITSELGNPIPYFPLVNIEKLLEDKELTFFGIIITHLMDSIDEATLGHIPYKCLDVVLKNVDIDDIKKFCYEIDLEYNPVLKKADLALWIDYSKSEKFMQATKHLYLEECMELHCLHSFEISLDADDKEYLIKALSDYVMDCCIYGIREEDIIESKKVS